MGRIKYNCVFGGGGIRGLCYPGALKAFKEYGIEINSVAGSSVGAVFAALYVCGYNEDEITELFTDFHLNMFRDININAFHNDLSISKGGIFLDWLREKTAKKLFGADYSEKDKKVVRFRDLKKDLYILTLDLNTNIPFIFSKENTPDAEVAFAARASACLPGLMKPVNYENMLLVDGDLIKSRPAWKIYESLDTAECRLLELRLEGSRDGSEIKSPADYINSVIDIIWYLSTENITDEYAENDRYDYIVFDTKNVIMFDFSLNKEKKEKLIDFGYKKTKEYLSVTLPKKRKKNLLLYNDMFLKYNTALKEINRNNTKQALNIINEILSGIYANLNKTDKSITTELESLKELLKAGTKKCFLFPAKQEKNVYKKAEFIYDLIRIRIEDINEYFSEIKENKC